MMGHNRKCTRLTSSSCNVLLAKLAKRRRFKTLNQILEDEAASSILVMDWMNALMRDGLRGRFDTPLHAVLAYDPPVTTVNLLIRRMVQVQPGLVPEEARNLEGRTPLHVACAYQANSDVVKRLLEGETLIIPALSRDCDDRFPLHWACVKQTGWFSKLRCMGSDWDAHNMVIVVATLIKAYPQAVHMRDVCGYKPLDLAVEYNVDHMILDMLQMRSIQQHPMKRRQHPSNDRMYQQGGSAVSLAGRSVVLRTCDMDEVSSICCTETLLTEESIPADATQMESSGPVMKAKSLMSTKSQSVMRAKSLMVSIPTQIDETSVEDASTML